MMLAVPPEKSASRVGEPFLSPPSTAKHTGSDVTFRSPKPANKASHIKVVTRIRPLLADEIVAGRQACITPIPCTQQPKSNITGSRDQTENVEFAVSPRNSQQTKFRESKIQSPNLLPSSTLKSPSLLPPKTQSLRNHAPSYKPPVSASTALHAGLGSNMKQFDFDAVLPMATTQQQVYNTVVGDSIVTDVFRGINFTIIAYGQTASGKSHTMQGYNNESNHSNSPQNDSENRCPNHGHSALDITENDGIIPRAIHDLFQGKKKYRSKGTVSIDMTFCEVYNDDIRDLLNTTDFQNLKILDQGDAGVILEGLHSIPIESAEQAHNLVNYAAQRRATASTYLNIQSSRSHAICTLTVSIAPFEKSRGTEITQAKLTLVDLAGSERIKQSGVVGVHQQESIAINKDLFVLGKVVAALSDKSRTSKEKHVAYRDSKLTRLLRESLGGNCFTVMISCVSPTDADIEESVNTLRYAERARSISNTIKRNVSQTILSPAQCTALTAENMRLKAMVTKLKKRVAAEISRDTAGSLLDQEESYAPTITSPPVEIFRFDSQSTSSSFSPPSTEGDQVVAQEKQSRKPVWLHFQDIAKMTKNVTIPMAAQVAVPHESQSEPAREIELRERSDSAANAGCKANVEPVQPERCLSYEMSLFPCGSNTDLVEGDEELKRIEQQVEDTKNLEYKTNALQKELEALKAERKETQESIMKQKHELAQISQLKTEMERSILEQKRENQVESEKMEALKDKQSNMEEAISRRKEELTSILETVEKTKTLMQSKNKEFAAVARQVNEERKELKDTKTDLECQLARRNELREEADHLESLVHNLTSHPSLLNLSSPQRSFARIWESEAKRNSDSSTASNTSFSELEATLKEQFKTLESHLGAPISTLQCPSTPDATGTPKDESTSHGSSPNSILTDPHSCISNAIDLAATIEEQKQDMEELEQQLCHEMKQRRLSDRDKMVMDTQVTCLQEKISMLETAVLALKDEKAVTQEQSGKEVDRLEAELTLETGRRKTLENQLNYANEDFDTISQTFNAKLGDLKDRSSRDKRELEHKVGLLQKTVENFQTENAVLQEQVRSLEGQSNKPTQESDTLAILAGIAQSKSEEMQSPQSEERGYMKAKASQMLSLADAAILNADGKSTCSSAGTDFRPLSNNLSTPRCHQAVTELEGTRSAENGESGHIQLTNLDMVASQQACSCSSNLFAEKTEYAEFYLPQITVDCMCGRTPPKPQKGEQVTEDPCALASILRPWQVEFLADQGIQDAISFCHIVIQRKTDLSRALRQWRKEKNLPVIKTRSCGVAIYIWSRTCKSVLRSVRMQRNKGIVVKRPDFLELNLLETYTAVSSLGGN